MTCAIIGTKKDRCTYRKKVIIFDRKIRLYIKIIYLKEIENNLCMGMIG